VISYKTWYKWKTASIYIQKTIENKKCVDIRPVTRSDEGIIVAMKAVMSLTDGPFPLVRIVVR